MCPIVSLSDETGTIQGGVMTRGTAPDLRLPIGVYGVALLFVVAPLANIVVSFAGAGVNQWYRPAQFFALVWTIALVDWIWIAGTIISGVALFLRHKSTWLIAVTSLVIVLLWNGYRALKLEPTATDAEFVRVQIIFAVVVSLSILVIGFYARYPYLDRRQQWIFPTAQRFSVRTPVVVHAGRDFAGLTESVSSAGLLVRLAEPTELPGNPTEVELTLKDVPSLGVITAEVVRRDQDVLRLRFKRFGWGARGILEGWLRSRPRA